ncbi:MKS1 [Acanthosepion pharaonis]|uniref:MKS1 n=1 Tax=Acanthosepion pharaonis TaxID=158019 RepID=A0A812EFD8_ACAPH|nr:MKS1 [Sepia pharaonis]
MIETSGLGREAFEYTIEHVSKTISSQEQDQEQKMHHELYNRHTDFHKAIVGNEFDSVPNDVLRLVVYGEIESAKNFEYNDLYLHFFVDLPKGWSSYPGQELSWVTQTCSTKVIHKENVAYYSFPFNFELFYKKELNKLNTSEDVPHFPIIYLEVLSLDSWQRYRTEGYSYLTIPPTPGLHKMKIDCWRPCGNSILAELRRFFIGGSPELEDPTYTGIPSTFEGSHFSKFGFRTETTGSVHLSLNVLMQSRSFIEMKASRKTFGNIMENLGMNAIQTNVLQVLAALKKAQTRMKLAREAAAVFQELRIKDE